MGVFFLVFWGVFFCDKEVNEEVSSCFAYNGRHICFFVFFSSSILLFIYFYFYDALLSINFCPSHSMVSSLFSLRLSKEFKF